MHSLSALVLLIILLKLLDNKSKISLIRCMQKYITHVEDQYMHWYQLSSSFVDVIGQVFVLTFI